MRILWSVFLFIAVTGLSGCATSGAQRAEPNPDPFENVNRAVYSFNDTLDRWVAQPVAKGYQRSVPLPVRESVSNFLANLRYPITIVHDFLQGKPRQGMQDLARFGVNSTLGLLGFFDPAGRAGMEAHEEDLGQTLAVWGVPDGPYLMLPIFGPNTVTGMVGDLADTQISPLLQLPDEPAVVWGLTGLYLLDQRYRILGFDDEVRSSFDPYLFVRDSYLQNRLYKIHDGQVPEDELYPEAFEDETAATE
jgi:phospholipid-binding lipoprotein MlaA